MTIRLATEMDVQTLRAQQATMPQPPTTDDYIWRERFKDPEQIVLVDDVRQTHIHIRVAPKSQRVYVLSCGPQARFDEDNFGLIIHVFAAGLREVVRLYPAAALWTMVGDLQGRGATPAARRTNSRAVAQFAIDKGRIIGMNEAATFTPSPENDQLTRIQTPVRSAIAAAENIISAGL